MFEQLFRYPGVIERYHAGPHAEDRLRYLVHLAGTGARTQTLQLAASRQLALVQLLDVRDDQRVLREQLDAAIERWAQPATASRAGQSRRSRGLPGDGDSLAALCRPVGDRREPAPAVRLVRCGVCGLDAGTRTGRGDDPRPLLCGRGVSGLVPRLEPASGIAHDRRCGSGRSSQERARPLRPDRPARVPEIPAGVLPLCRSAGLVRAGSGRGGCTAPPVRGGDRPGRTGLGTTSSGCWPRPRARGPRTDATAPRSCCWPSTACVPARSVVCGWTMSTGMRRRSGCAVRSRGGRTCTRSPGPSERRCWATCGKAGRNGPSARSSSRSKPRSARSAPPGCRAGSTDACGAWASTPRSGARTR